MQRVGDRDRSTVLLTYVERMKSWALKNSPIQIIAQTNAFKLDPDDLEEVFGFEKPSPDETLVFSSAAKVRSVYVRNFVAEAGYSNLVNNTGGSHEWFGDR